MFFNKGLVNGREAIAFWPDRKAAGYRSGIRSGMLPDYVLPTQTRASDGMTVVDVADLTPLLHWKASFANAEAFLDTAVQCQAQGWCLALTLDTVFVRKDGTLCLIALPFEDESRGDIDALRSYLANPEGFDAFKRLNDVEAYISPEHGKTDKPDFSFFGLHGNPDGAQKEKDGSTGPAYDFFGVDQGIGGSDKEDGQDETDIASILGGAGEAPPKNEIPDTDGMDDFTRLFGEEDEMEPIADSGIKTPEEPEEPETDFLSALFGGALPGVEPPVEDKKDGVHPAVKPEENPFGGLFGLDDEEEAPPEPVSPASEPPAVAPAEGTTPPDAAVQPDGEVPSGEKDKQVIVDAFQKFAKAFEIYMGGEGTTESRSETEPPEPDDPVNATGQQPQMGTVNEPEPVVEPEKPAGEPEAPAIGDDDFSGMFAAFQAEDVPVATEPAVSEPEAVVEPEKPAEEPEAPVIGDDGFSDMFAAFQAEDVPVATEPAVNEPEAVVEPEKPAEEPEAPAIGDDDFSDMFAAFQAEDGIVTASDAATVQPETSQPIVPSADKEPVAAAEETEGTGPEGSFSDVMSFFEDLLGLDAEEEEH